MQGRPMLWNSVSVFFFFFFLLLFFFFFFFFIILCHLDCAAILQWWFKADAVDCDNNERLRFLNYVDYVDWWCTSDQLLIDGVRVILLIDGVHLISCWLTAYTWSAVDWWCTCDTVDWWCTSDQMLQFTPSFGQPPLSSSVLWCRNQISQMCNLKENKHVYFES